MATGETSASEAAPPRPLPPNAVHLVRTALQSHMTLSQMADQKANMVIGAAFVVFTLAVGQTRTGTMMLPIAILASGAFLAAICAILAVLPKVTRPGEAARATVGEADNLLFFGVFTRLEENEFIDRVIARLATDESTYRTMLRDIYQNGQVLERKKYRWLSYAYRAFLIGLLGSFVAFALELISGWRM